jgi:lipid II:glycine glycyltransferase (peptidoglycan interpeptide bridge formation enzyme)
MTKLEEHFFHSVPWAQFQRELGREVFMENGEGWSFLGYAEKGRFSKRLYCPYGPTCDDNKSFKTSVVKLTTLAREKNLDFLRLEPVGNITEADLIKLGFNRRKSHLGVQPIRTVVNDVSISPEEISATVNQKVRRYTRKAEKQGLTYSLSQNPEDMRYFIEMIHEVSARTGMRPWSDQYFAQIAKTLFPAGAAGLIFAEFQGKKIASIVYYKTDTTMYYAHAASLTEYRNLSPATGLGLFAMKFAHDQGCQRFDWCGISSDKTSNSSALFGITEFKLSFGGTVKDYLGAWELPLNKPKYLLYRVLLKLTGKS